MTQPRPLMEADWKVMLSDVRATYLKAGLVVCVDFEHQSKPQVDLLGSSEAGIDVKHLLKCFNRPEKQRREKARLLPSLTQKTRLATPATSFAKREWRVAADGEQIRLHRTH